MTNATLEKPEAALVETLAPAMFEATTPDITPAMLQEWGYVAWRYFDDGEVMGILPMTFGKGRLCSGLNSSGYEDCWCFPSVTDALIAMHRFNPESDKEPTGWHRHPFSGRRRENCDPAKETVYL